MTLLTAVFFSLVGCDEDLSSDFDVDADMELLPDDQLPVPPVITQIGSCPGAVTFTISSFTPGGGFRIGRSPNLGPGTPITTGPCAGTSLRIGPPTTLVASGTAPLSGTVSYGVTLGPAACGQYLQALDMATCQTSMWHQIF